MFIPVLLIMLCAIFSQVSKTGTFNLDALKTVFNENGEIVSFGWVPTMSLCVTVSGFIIFFENCRPFTKFRKILYALILALVILILYLAPEFFIISGTDMLASGAKSDITKIFTYVFNHVGPNAQFALYRTMDTAQWVFLLIYTALAYPIYWINKKVMGKIVDALLFSPREFKDE